MGKRGRKDIAKDGAKTRFGQPGGPDPRKATKNGPPKWSVQKQVRYMGAKTVAEIRGIVAFEPTAAQLIAAVAINKSIKGDMRAVEYVTERIDGKVPQTNINAEWEDVKNASDEQLDAIIRDGLGLKAASGAGDSGKKAATGSEGKGMGTLSGSPNRGAKKPG